jgi:Glycosyl hydrolases family 16
VAPTHQPQPGTVLDRSGFELVVDEQFDEPVLDLGLWLPYYLPHWSSRAAAAARYDVGGGSLRLRIDHDQPPWNPEFDGALRVSSLQTALVAGPVGSPSGQHRFRADLVVREAQGNEALYTPQYGLFEIRLRALADPSDMVALWMIGTGDVPEHSAEICIVEIFGRDVGAREARVGMGLHPFGDATIRDEFAAEPISIDATEPHDYAAVWTPDAVTFAVDGHVVRVVRQSPAYPMQFMLGIYEFAESPAPPASSDGYPKELVVDWFRGWRPRSQGSARAKTGS